ncbi:MAG: glutathione S-transferase family protein [Novosphingobium sp.]|nr:glutathione S-transferase family protein [Novosphingobium sp.]
MAERLELYHAEPLSNSLKVLQAIHEKGVPFVSHQIDLRRFEQHDPKFLAVNPAGQVPVLVHGGRTIVESTVINEYLDEAFEGPRLRPDSPFGRAQMRVWTKFVDEVFRPALSFLAWARQMPALVAALPDGEFEQRLARIPLREKRDKWALAARGGFAQRELEGWRENLIDANGRIERALETSDWLVEDGFSLADIAVFSMANSLPRGHPDIMNNEAAPRAIAWLERMRARPGVAAALAVPTPQP